LIERARALDLARAYSYALRLVARVLHTPVPRPSLAVAAQAGPPWPFARVIEAIFETVLKPPPLSGARPAQGLCSYILFIRSHWLRMPLRLLLPHLLRKAIRRFRAPREAEAAAGGA
jgi:hypothetical protein